MTAATVGTTIQTDASLVLAALDPGPFGPAGVDSRPMTVLEHTLSRAESHLQDALVLFEQTGEDRLADAVSTLILRVIDRMGEVAEEGGRA